MSGSGTGEEQQQQSRTARRPDAHGLRDPRTISFRLAPTLSPGSRPAGHEFCRRGARPEPALGALLRSRASQMKRDGTVDSPSLCAWPPPPAARLYGYGSPRARVRCG